MSEPMIMGHAITARRVNSDTANSPTKKFSPQSNASSSDHTRKVVIEQIPSRKKPPQASTSSSKENRSTIHDEQNQHRQASQSTTHPDVFERLDTTWTRNMNAKRFKADTSHNSERSHGWEGMGEM